MTGTGSVDEAARLAIAWLLEHRGLPPSADFAALVRGLADHREAVGHFPEADPLVSAGDLRFDPSWEG